MGEVGGGGVGEEELVFLKEGEDEDEFCEAVVGIGGGLEVGLDGVVEHEF